MPVQIEIIKLLLIPNVSPLNLSWHSGVVATFSAPGLTDKVISQKPVESVCARSGCSFITFNYRVSDLNAGLRSAFVLHVFLSVFFFYISGRHAYFCVCLFCLELNERVHTHTEVQSSDQTHFYSQKHFSVHCS